MNTNSLTLLTVSDLAAKLNVRPNTVRTWINAGYIPGGFKLGAGRVHRFNANIIDKWIEDGCPRPLKQTK
jgi:excisionase family DNA binding protein